MTNATVLRSTLYVRGFKTRQDADKAQIDIGKKFSTLPTLDTRSDFLTQFSVAAMGSMMLLGAADVNIPEGSTFFLSWYRDTERAINS